MSCFNYFYFELRYDALAGEIFPGLILSILRGHVDEIRQVLIDGADVDQRCKYLHNATLLHIAADCEHEEQEVIVELLIKFGAKINAVDRCGNTALHIALMRNTDTSRRIACVLIDNGCDINIYNRHNRTPFFYACKVLNLPIIRKILHSGVKYDTVDKNRRTLVMELFYTENEAVDILIKHNICTMIKDCHNNTFLHVAACCDNITTVDSIINSGIDIDAVNNKGEQALHIACLNGPIRTVYHIFNCYPSFDGLLEFVTKHAGDFSPRIVKLIWWNSAKLYALNKTSVHNKLSTMFNVPRHCSENIHSEFMKEIEKLKNTWIDETSVTLYDFLLKDSSEVVKLLENNSVVKYLSEYKLIGVLKTFIPTIRNWLQIETYEIIPDRFFDVYNGNIYCRFQMGLKRKLIIDQCKRLTVYCSLCCLPLFCLEVILFQLSNSDLTAFIEAFNSMLNSIIL